MRPGEKMKYWTILAIAILNFAGNTPVAAKCTGSAQCTDCTNCERCWHCNRQGGKCGACSQSKVSRPGTKPTQRPVRKPVASSTSIISGSGAGKPPASKPKLLRLPTGGSKTANHGFPKSFSARCVDVIDGDSIKVAYGPRTVSVRLFAIDAPELNQAFGKRAKANLAEVTVGRNVKIYPVSIDGYGRLLAWAFIGPACLNKELVREGNAWHYKKYAEKAAVLAELEQSARKSKKGLWEQPKPTAPWEWRHNKR